MTTPCPTEPTADIAELAGLEFEAWKHYAGEWKPPSNTEWADLANPHLISVRLAWLILHKSKSELVEAGLALGDEGVQELVQQLGQSADYFEGLHEILSAAECRIISAYATQADT